MGVVDVVLIVFILVFAFKGTINGFITEAISILGIILAILCSYMLFEPLFKIMQYFRVFDCVCNCCNIR